MVCIVFENRSFIFCKRQVRYAVNPGLRISVYCVRSETITVYKFVLYGEKQEFIHLLILLTTPLIILLYHTKKTNETCITMATTARNNIHYNTYYSGGTCIVWNHFKREIAAVCVYYALVRAHVPGRRIYTS